KPFSGWVNLFVQVILANVILVAFLLWFSPPVAEWLLFDWEQRIMWLFGLVFAVIALYAVSLLLLGLNPKKMLKTPE
ncbi:MAG: murein biosynthesis integral membrane protein MurJ, partial [Thiomicrorhabdus sp.]|nr:murein biosynthesis integral membrane protein MurJ [Thiomicrorhabdus sp.]